MNILLNNQLICDNIYSHCDDIDIFSLECVKYNLYEIYNHIIKSSDHISNYIHNSFTIGQSIPKQIYIITIGHPVNYDDQIINDIPGKLYKKSKHITMIGNNINLKCDKYSIMKYGNIQGNNINIIINKLVVLKNFNIIGNNLNIVISKYGIINDINIIDNNKKIII